MLSPFGLFVNHLLNLGKFCISQFPGNAYRSLMTACGELLSKDFVTIPSMIDFAKQHPGYLVIDDTSNPKYGLKQWCRKLYIPGTGAYLQGFKVVLFLWVCDAGRFPIGFGLWHKRSQALTEIALNGLSQMRNWFRLKPRYVFADGAYSTNTILKRLDDYGFGLVMRFKNDRKLDGLSIRQQIPRGYGETAGAIENGTTLKVIRHQKHFVATNRMLLERQAIQALYAIRWKVEEVFRCLKSIIGLDGCHQVSIRAQTIYLILCMLLFSCLEQHSADSPYKTAQAVISGDLHPENLIHNKPFLSF
jgi:hypothetical protein